MMAAICAITATSAAVAKAPDGQALFHQRCQACHTADAGQPARVGPNLSGVVGRKAASTPFSYSPALKKSGLTWTRSNLNKFLTAPVTMVPGTRMVIALPDAAQRKAVIDYLATLR